VAANWWAGFSSIAGWTTLTSGTIELWNNLNNVKATDGVNFDELDFRVIETDSTSEDRCGVDSGPGVRRSDA
jgi:hypothetical protein